MSCVLEGLKVPIIQAPMAGGPSTPALAAAVGRAGGFGFLAAGYLSVDRLAEDLVKTRALTERFGVNVFVGGGHPADPAAVARYAGRLRVEADRAGVTLGEARFDRDSFDEKIELLRSQPVSVVSFTFGLPERSVIETLRGAGSEVWLTVTSPQEARQAAAVGADALVVQGVEAGGHRGVFIDDEGQSDLTLLAALQLIRTVVDLPSVAAGAIMTGAALAAVLVAGASAAQLGTAYLRATEAQTPLVQREALASDGATVLTRAFSGRMARGIRNRWHDDYGAEAPRAYPEVNYLTSPLRAHGRTTGDPDLVNLWAGQAHQLAEEAPAEEITQRLVREARRALAAGASRLA